jgi:hypothetical protein
MTDNSHESKGYVMQKSLGALFALAALALAACSGGGASGGANNGNPLTGVVITIPTPTPPPTPTPVPTPTPAGVQNVIADPGFETEGAAGAFNPTSGWSACSVPELQVSTKTPPPTPFPAIASATGIGAGIVSSSTASFPGNGTPPTPAVTSQIHGGSFAALTFSGVGPASIAGGSSSAGASGVCQTFTVPTNAMLTMFVNEGGTDSGLDFADQMAYLTPVVGGVPTGAPIVLFQELNAPSYVNMSETGGTPGTGESTAGGTYVMKGPFALTAAPYNLTPGAQYQLFIGSYDKEPGGGFGVYMYVDDVAVTGTPVTPASLHRNSLMNSRSFVK